MRDNPTPYCMERYLAKVLCFSSCTETRSYRSKDSINAYEYVRNTVVRATIKVNGKPQILGTRSPLTPQSIGLKFDTDDYTSAVGPHMPKNGESRPSRAGPVDG